ncbi:MAG: hypothetical protein ACI8UO_001783 [Verrucomicrobiales bacterium]|jgi:hypothetical protein
MAKSIFISCVTDEFADLRLRRRNGLVRAGYNPVIQPDFHQDAADTLRKIHDIVQSCDAVVHIIGSLHGSVCNPRALDDFRDNCPAAADILANLDAPDGLTYTQWEAVFGLHYQIPLFVHTSLEPRSPDHPQKTHLDRLASKGRYAELYTSEDELTDKIQADLNRAFGGEPERRPFNLPGSIGRLFKGRDTFIETLRTRLIARRAAAVTATQAVHGLGGIGKTRLAIEYGHRYAGEYSALLLARADSADALAENLARLTGSNALNLPEDIATERDVRLQAVLDWLDAHRGWFLILDNADAEDAADAIQQLLGEGRLTSGHLLITSRLGVWGAEVEPMDLDVLDEDAAVEFLLERTGANQEQSTKNQAQRLAIQLGYLALEQAAAYIARHRISIATYLDRLEARRPELLKWYDPRRMNYPFSVAATWETSFDALTPAARQLLDALAFLAPDPIPAEMIRSGIRQNFDGDDADTDVDKGLRTRRGAHPEDRGLAPRPSAETRDYSDETLASSATETLESALLELADFSLIRFLEDPPETISMHRLLQEVVRQRLDTEPAQRAAWEPAVQLVDAWAPDEGQEIETWPKWQILGPHCEALFERAESWDNPAPVPRLLNGYAQFQEIRNGDYAAAEPLYRRALEARERVLGAEHPDTLGSLNNLAALLDAKDDYAAAEPLLRRALEARERVLGAEHPDTLLSLNNLAGFLLERGRAEEALPLFRRARDGREAALGPDHPSTLRTVWWLAVAAEKEGRLAEALEGYECALAGFEAKLGVEHPDTRKLRGFTERCRVKME